jgi:hypothetical protein
MFAILIVAVICDVFDISMGWWLSVHCKFDDGLLALCLGCQRMRIGDFARRVVVRPPKEPPRLPGGPAAAGPLF